MKDKFNPAEGVTFDNALRYLEAIEQAIKTEIKNFPKSERSMMLGVMAGSIAQVSDSLFKLRKDMERRGESTPVTEEQKQMTRIIFRKAIAEEKPES